MGTLLKVLAFLVGAALLIGALGVYLFASVDDGKGWALFLAGMFGVLLMTGSD